MIFSKEVIGNSSGLKSRLLFLLFAFLVYRIGSHIPVPGLDCDKFSSVFSNNEAGILSLFNLFSGGSLSRLTIFALGVMPYISCTIVMQLLTVVWAPLVQLSKEGQYGKRKISQYTRYLTLFFSVIQAFSMVKFIIGPNVDGNIFLYYFIVVMTLVTGTMFLMWLGEQITEKGVGNGTSIIICVSIISSFPSFISGILNRVKQGETHFFIIFCLFLFLIFLVFLIIFVEKGQRRVIVNYAKRQHGRKMYAAQKSFLPLKINFSGVIPPIFASSLLLFPTTISQWFGYSENPGFFYKISHLLYPGQPLYILFYGFGIVFFCFFYTALVFNPKDISNNLKKSGGCLPGIRPGEQTEMYIDKVVMRLTVIGSLYITFISLSPELLGLFTGVSFYFGGTSLLIVVVVSMDFVANVQAQVMSQQYENLMKKSKLRGLV